LLCTTIKLIYLQTFILYDVLFTNFLPISLFVMANMKQVPPAVCKGQYCQLRIEFIRHGIDNVPLQLIKINIQIKPIRLRSLVEKHCMFRKS